MLVCEANAMFVLLNFMLKGENWRRRGGGGSFDVGLHSGVYEPVSFKLGVIVDTTILYGMVPV